MGSHHTETSKTVWGNAAFALGLLVYGVLYFGSAPEHRRGLLYLLIPDEVLRSWSGGDFGQLTVVDRLPVLLAAGGILGLAFVFGRLSLAAIGGERGLSRLEIVVFSVGVGLNELSLLTLAIGLAGGLHSPWIFAACIGVVCSLAAWAWKRQPKRGQSLSGQRTRRADPASELRPRSDSPLSRGIGERHSDRWGLWMLWMGLPFLMLILLGGMLPPWDFDVREYHLQVPKEWFQQGRIGFLPHNVYGNMPLGAELHSLLAMVFWPGQQAWWWGALVGKTVIACFAPLTALSLLAAGRRFASQTAGVVAAVTFLSIPWVAHVSISGLVEGASAFYTFSTLYAMLLWSTGSGLEHDADRGRTLRGRLLLAGFLAGSAVACKYPALLFVLTPAVVWCVCGPRPFFHPDRSVRKNVSRLAAIRWQPAAALLLAAACGCGLWLGKNWVLAGNPVYPMYFGGRTRTVEGLEQWNRAHRVPRDERGRRYSPHQAAEAMTRVLWRSPWQSAILIPLSIAGLLLLRKPRRSNAQSEIQRGVPRDSQQQLLVACTVFAAFFLLVWWLVTHRLDRFWVPVLPAIAMLAGIGATWSVARSWRYLLLGALICGLTANFLIVLGNHPHRYLVALDALRVDIPKEPDGPSRVHPAHRYLNANLPPDGCVLLVGDAQPFDLAESVLYNTCFDESIFERLLKDRTPQERRAALRERGISHVLINWNEIARYRSPGNYGFTDFVTRDLVQNQLVRAQGILRKLPIGAESDGWELYEVVGRE